MPKGKSRTSCYVVISSDLPVNVDLSNILLSCMPGYVALGEERLNKHTETILAAIQFYIDNNRDSQYLTNTQKNSALNKLINCADKLQRSIKSNYPTQETIQHNDKLLELLSQLDVNSKAYLYKSFTEPMDSITLSRALKDFPAVPYPPNFISFLKAIQKTSRSSETTETTNPAYIPLIRSLAPIWKDITGRTMRWTENKGIREQHFAQWLGTILKQAGVKDCPTASQTNDIITKYL